MPAANNQPAATKRFDRVQIAIRRHKTSADNAASDRFDMTFSRSYQDAQGAWRRSHSFSPRDLPHLQLAINWAMRELLLKDE